MDPCGTHEGRKGRNLPVRRLVGTWIKTLVFLQSFQPPASGGYNRGARRGETVFRTTAGDRAQHQKTK